MSITSTPAPATGAPGAAAADAAPAQSLRSRSIRGSLWAIGGYVASTVLRMGSNLILTRILFPEAFGLMVYVNVLVQGLEMFSDLGIRVSIVQHSRGDDPVFLNTAWTIQVLRGFALWICSCLIAWPVAAFYGQPELVGMLPVAGFASVLAGFQSTRLSTLNRQMQVARFTVIALLSAVAGTVVMVLLALWTRSVWSLLAFGLVNSLTRTVLSHVAVAGIRNRLCWDAEARRSLFGLGKWIFASTLFTFLANQSDKLMLGKYADTAVLGVYSIAVSLTAAATQVLWELCEWVLFPAFSRVNREDATRMRDVFGKVRARLDLLVMPCLGLLIAAGDVIVHAMWDSRYHEAGWMLQVLSVGVACYYMLPFAWACQAARGDLRYWMCGNVGRTLWLFLGVPPVWHWGGLRAAIWFIALSQLPPLAFAWLRLHRDGILSLRREAVAALYLALGMGAGWLLKQLLVPAGLA